MLIIYKVTIKEGKTEEFQKLARETLIPEAYGLTGCQLFSLYQNTTNASEFIFHEVWDSDASVHEYKAKLIAALGQPNPGEEFPAVMNALIETDEDLM